MAPLRVGRGWIIVVAVAALCVPTAAAHGDAPSIRDTVILEPGQSATWERELHWHRMLGSIEADGPVRLIVTGPDGADLVADDSARVFIDHLVACCRDATWTPHSIRVTNLGAGAVEARVEIALLHDNIAVLADDAEPGGWWQTLVLVLAVVAVPAWRARAAGAPEGSASDWIRRSRIAHATAWMAAGLLAAIGMVRFGSGPIVGSLAATAWTPTSVAGFFNTHTFVMLALMATWATSIAFWAGARRRAGSSRRYPRDGILFAAGPLLVALLMGIEVGGWPIAAALGLVPTAALALDAFGPTRR